MFAVQPPLGLTPVSKPSFSPGGWPLEYGDSRETELRTRVKNKEEHVLAAAPTPVLYFQKCPLALDCFSWIYEALLVFRQILFTSWMGYSDGAEDLNFFFGFFRSQADCSLSGMMICGHATSLLVPWRKFGQNVNQGILPLPAKPVDEPQLSQDKCRAV